MDIHLNIQCPHNPLINIQANIQFTYINIYYVKIIVEYSNQYLFKL